MPTVGAIYRHYKGNEYEVVCIAKNETDLSDLVIYKSVRDPAQIWARPLAAFIEEIEVDGVKKPRFEYIS